MGRGCGLKFGVFVSSSFSEGNSISRNLGVRFYCCCCCCEISRAPPSPSRCSVFSSLFYLVFVRRGFCFRELFFSWKGLVKREREREEEFFLMTKQKKIPVSFGDCFWSVRASL